jgi:hypothetical protein
MMLIRTLVDQPARVHERWATVLRLDPVDHRRDLGVQVALVAVPLERLLASLLERFRVEDAALLVAAHRAAETEAAQDAPARRDEEPLKHLVLEDGVPVDRELVHAILNALLERDLEACFAVRRIDEDRVRHDGRVQISLRAVERRQVRFQIGQVLGLVERAGPEPPEALAIDVHRPAQLVVGHPRVADELHLGHGDPLALLDVDDDVDFRGLAVDRLEAVLDVGERNSLFGEPRADERLRVQDALAVQRDARLEPHGVTHHARGEILEAVDVHPPDPELFHDFDDEDDRIRGNALGTHHDVAELPARQHGLDPALDVAVHDLVAGKNPEQPSDGLRLDALRAPDDDRIDDERARRLGLG